MKSSLEFKKNEQKLNSLCRLLKSKEDEKVSIFLMNKFSKVKETMLSIHGQINDWFIFD